MALLQNNDAAKAILKKLNGTVVDLEEHFRKGWRMFSVIKSEMPVNSQYSGWHCRSKMTKVHTISCANFASRSFLRSQKAAKVWQ